MPEYQESLLLPTIRKPWHKGTLIGPKPPLQPKHVGAIRTNLQLEKRARYLALFNLAIDSKRHGCDVVAVRVDDVAPRGYAIDRAIVRQKKMGRPVKFELTEQTRESIDAYLTETRREVGQCLFPGRGAPGADAGLFSLRASGTIPASTQVSAR